MTFDIDAAMRLIRKAVRPFPKAAMFALRDEGYASVFEQLIACIISIRTRDEQTVTITRKLFAKARNAAAIKKLGVTAIDRLIRNSTFHEAKSKTIHDIANETVSHFGGDLPCDREVFVSFAGVGPKCANLVLGVACGIPAISVDTHVHRVTNRWGYVNAKTPQKTMIALEARLPRRYWIAINELLVPFGKHVCTPARPRCLSCPLLKMCRQVGVRFVRS